MRRYLEELKDFTKKCDWLLLILLLIVSGFGCVCIASATSAPKFDGAIRYVVLQVVAIALGVGIFALVSAIDLDVLSEYRLGLVAFNILLLLMLMAGVGFYLHSLQGQVSAAQAEKARLAQEVAQLQAENDSLTEDIEKGTTPEMMAEIARTELGLVESGEYVFDIIS